MMLFLHLVLTFIPPPPPPPHYIIMVKGLLLFPVSFRVTHRGLALSRLSKSLKGRPLCLQVLLWQGHEPPAKVQGGANGTSQLWRALPQEISSDLQLVVPASVSSVVSPRTLSPLSRHGDKRVPLWEEDVHDSM